MPRALDSTAERHDQIAAVDFVLHDQIGNQSYPASLARCLEGHEEVPQLDSWCIFVGR